MKFSERATGVGKCLEIRSQWNTGQFLGQVVGEAVPVRRRVEDAINVIEDPILGDRAVIIVGPECPSGGVGDVVDAFQFRPLLEFSLSIGLVHHIPVSRETLTSCSLKVKIRHRINHEGGEGLDRHSSCIRGCRMGIMTSEIYQVLIEAGAPEACER